MIDRIFSKTLFRFLGKGPRKVLVSKELKWFLRKSKITACETIKISEFITKRIFKKFSFLLRRFPEKVLVRKIS